MNKLISLTGLLLSGTFLNAQGLSSDTVRVDANITNSTVYFGYGAELTHETKARVDGSTKIIVISQLSTSADLNSLQVSVPEEVALLSQRYSVFYPSLPPVVKSRDIEKLEDSIQLMNREISRLDNLLQIDQEVLTKTGALIEGSLNNIGDKTLSGEELLKLVEYYTARIEKIKNNMFNNR